jgi:hypothetical protein
MSETFLSRWSRRKRAASIPPPASAASGGEGGERSPPGGGSLPSTQAPVGKREEGPTPDPSPPFASRAEGAEPHGPARQETEFDPASLPPIESIDAGTDVSAFLRPGVPADLAQAALRRAWVADPAIRDFVGLAENAWDFNAPGGVPGFEPLRAIDDVQRLVAHVTGALPDAAPQPAAPAEGTNIAQAPQPGPPATSAPVLPDEPVVAPTDDAATQQGTHGDDPGASPRPRHGGALAE